MLLDEILELAGDHVAEVIPFEGLTPNVNRFHYEAANAAGILRFFTARNNKALAGYALFVVCRHPHFYDVWNAVQELIYLAPAYRAGAIGRQFLEWCDVKLEREGVEIIYHHSSLKRDIGPILERIGYAPVQTVYARRVK